MFDRIRAAWRAFWSTSTAIPAVASEPEKPPLRISPAALWEAEKQGARSFMPEETFRALIPLPGVLPNGMALDSQVADVNVLASYAIDQLHHEGLGFLGYPYLAELSQRAEYRQVVSMWAEYCTKKWIKITGDDAKVKELQAELDRLKVRDVFNDAITKEGFFGRIHVFMDFGDWDKAGELTVQLAVDSRKINQNRPLQRLTVVEPMWAYPGPYNAQNPLAPTFYKPSSWYMSGRTVHDSRLLTLVSNPMPNMLKPAYAFGGVSRTQQIKAYVDNWLRSRQSSSDLLHAFSVMVLHTNMESVLGGGTGDDLWKRVDLFNKTRDNRGTFVIDKNEEDFTNVAAPISGVDKLVGQALEQISAISGIPISILLGQTPSGLNASSEGEIRIFYDRVMSWLDTNVRPQLHTLLQVIQLSLWGKIDESIAFEFEALWEMSDADKAAIRKSDAEADTAYIAAGVVDAEEVRERLREDETSLYHGVDLSGPAPDVPEDNEEDEQRFPFADDGWNESDHPRDKDGKFGEGGAGSTGGGEPSPLMVLKHVSKVIGSKGNHPALTLGRASEANVALVRTQTGYNIAGHSRVLESSDIRHAFNRHSDVEKEAERQQVAIGKQDFTKVQAITEGAHRIELKGDPGGGKGQRLVYHATVDGHVYEYVEHIRPNAQIVAFKTIRKRLA